MDAFKGKWERTSAENYEELLKVNFIFSLSLKKILKRKLPIVRLAFLYKELLKVKVVFF